MYVYIYIYICREREIVLFVYRLTVSCVYLCALSSESPCLPVPSRAGGAAGRRPLNQFPSGRGAKDNNTNDNVNNNNNDNNNNNNNGNNNDNNDNNEK